MIDPVCKPMMAHNWLMMARVAHLCQYENDTGPAMVYVITSSTACHLAYLYWPRTFPLPAMQCINIISHSLTPNTERQSSFLLLKMFIVIVTTKTNHDLSATRGPACAHHRQVDHTKSYMRRV